PKSHKSSGSYGDSVVVEEFQRTVKEEVALEKAKRQTKKKIRCKQDQCLERQRNFPNQSLTRKILKERIKKQELHAKSKHRAIHHKKKEFEEKGRGVKREDVFRKQQSKELFGRSNEELWKLGSNIWQRCADELEGKGKVWHCHELCCRLQAQVIQCSRENT
uniref:Uncharacterized protein n=1 Tax=Sus scrofa TaxID=9823 RepID=A0A8D1UXY0_PIG